MQKFLRTLTLLAFMVVPWVTQAQQTLPYSYGFEDNDLATDGWLLLNSSSSSTGISSSAAQNGSYGFQFNYSESNDATLISPVLTGTTNGVTVSFSYKESSDSYGDEQFYVGYTTDETVTDPSDFTYGSIITASLSWQQYENTFPAGTKRIAIKYVYNDALNLFLDDFTFEAPSSCVKPSAINITGATTSSISISWTPAGSETSWNVYLNGVQVNTTPVATTSYIFTGLTENNDYTLGVSAICGSSESALKTTTVHLGYCVPNPTSVDGSGISNVTFGSSLIVNDNLSMTSSPYYYDHSSQIGDVFPGGTVNMSINYVTNYAYYTWVWVDWNNDFTFSESEKVYAATSSISSGILNLSFDVPINTPLGDYRMRIMGKDGTTNNPCYTGSYAYLVDYTLRVSTPPSCMPVTALTGTPSGTTVTLTWTDENNTGATYIVKEGENILSSNATSPYVINGVTLGDHTYSVMVDCGSSTANPVSTNVHVGYCVPSPSSVDGSGITSVSFGGMTNTTHPGSTAGYGDYSSMAGSVPASTTATVEIIYGHQYSYGTIIWVDWNNDFTFSGDEVVYAGQSDGGNNPHTLTATFEVPATQAVGNYRMRILGSDSDFDNYTGSLSAAANANPCATGYSWGVAEDYTLTVAEAPSCMPVSDLAYSNLTDAGVILSWTDPNGGSNTYVVKIGDDVLSATTTPAVTFNGTTATITGLTALTSYTFSVAVDCGSATSPSSNISVTTPCGAETMPWTENFDSWTSKSTCWSFLSGAYNRGNGTPTTYSSAWTLSSSYGSYITLSGKALAMNIYSTYRYWAVTPNINITTNDAVLNVDVAVSAWSAATTNYDADDTLAFAISTDGGATFTHLMALNNTELNALANTYTTISVPVSGYNGQTVRFAIFGGSSASGGDNRIVIDNVTVDVAPTCYKPTALTYDNVTTNGATLTWTRDTRNADGETYSILDENDQVVTGAANISGTSFQLTGLNQNTEYTFKVRTNCANPLESVDVLTVTFTTLANCPIPEFEATGITNVAAHTADVAWTGFSQNDSYNVHYRSQEYIDGMSEEFGTSAPTGWTMYTGLLSNIMNGTALTSATSGWNFGTNNGVFDNHARTNIYSNYQRWLVTPNIEVGSGYGLSFDLALTQYSGTLQPVTAGSQADDKFVVLISTDNKATWNILRQWDNAGSEYVYDNIPCTATGETVNIDLASYNGQNVNIAFYGESTVSGGDNNLHIDNVAIGQLIPAGAWQTASVTSTSTTLTGLTAETPYEVKIEGVCGSEVSAAMSDLQVFTTLPSCMPVDGLAVGEITTNSIALTWSDSYNSGATYIIYMNGAEYATGVTGTSYTVTGLTANTEYSFAVKANCGSVDGLSDMTAAVSARTACEAITLPHTWTFEAEELQSTTQATALPWCSYRKVESVTYPNYPYSYSGTSYAHESSRSLYFYGTTSTTYPELMAWIMPAVDVTNFPMNGNRVNFYARSSSTSYNKVVKAYALTDPTDWSTATYVDEVTVIGTTHELYSINLAAAPANAPYLAIAVERGSGSLYLDDLTLEEMPSCVEISNLQVTDVTTNSISLAWDDAINPATTGYTVTYTDATGDHSVPVEAGVHVATVTGLEPNTEYTFGVIANCASANSPSTTVTGRTACTAQSLPYAEDFSEYTGFASTSYPYYGPSVMPHCWLYYSNGTNTALTNSTSSYYGGVGVATGTSYGSMVANDKYLYMPVQLTGANVTSSTYLNYETQRGSVKIAAMPLFEQPLSNLKVSFNYKMSTAYSATGAAAVLELGYISNDDFTTFQPMQSWNAVSTTQSVEMTLNELAVAAPAGARLAFRFSGTHNGTGTSSYTTVHCGIDNISVEEIPTVLGVTASNVTANSVDLNWDVFRTCTGATYTVTYGTQSTEVSSTNTTISGLTPNTEYTFDVSSSCAAANEPHATVTVNTLQIPATLPYATGFETTDDNAMWTILNGTNGWYFGTAANNDGAQGLYISNDNGTNNAYTNNVATWSYAYRLINIAEAGWYNFSFDWKANGESTWDYLRAWLAPTNMDITANANPSHSTASTSGYNTTTPEGWIDLNPAGGKLNLSSDYQSLENVLQVETAGQYYLVLAWANDGSGGTNPPAAVDNVSVVRNAFEPTELTAENITSTGATLTWTRDTRNAGVETYTIKKGTETVATGIDANSYAVTLTPNTDYTFTLFAETDGDVSDAENVSIRVNEYPTEAGKMVNLAYSYDFTATAAEPSVSFYYGMGATRTATAAQTLTAETATGATFTNTTSANWPVDGPVTVVLLNHNANVLNFTPEVTYLCPAVVNNTDPVEQTINTGSYTWTTPENHEYTYGPLKGTTLDEQVAALVGSYHDTVKNAGGCDSIYRHLNLTLYPTYEVTLSDEFCQGTTYTVGTGAEAHNYTASVQEDVHLTALGGADSLVHVDLHMNAAPVALINNNVNNTINSYCEGFDLTLTATAVEGASAVTGATFEWEDASTAATRTVNPLSTTTNVYTLTATDPVTGCVSLEPATLTVTTTPVPVLTVTADREAICVGQNSAVLTVTDANNIAGVNFRWYNANTSTVAGTGATLTVNPTETTSYYVVAEGDCEVQSAPITITVNALPVVTVAAAPAVVCQNDNIALTATSVDGYSYSWNTNATTAEATVVAATTGNYTLTVTDQNGCVNEFTTNNVTVNPVYELNDAQSVCYLSNPYTWKAGTQTAMNITEDGNYNYTFQTVNGCDSLVHLTFAFEQMSINNTYREVCQNTDVTWGPTTYPSVQESATLTYELGVGDTDPDNNVLDCPAQYNLILTVNPVKATSFDQVACDSYTWTLNNETYTANANPSVTLATTKGCDSTVTMNLTVNYQNTGIDNQVACDRYEWPLNHTIYTASTNEPVVTLAGANAMGCDSVVTLNLTVNYKQENTVFYRECDDTVFVWNEGNGLTYNRNVNPEANITWNLTTADPTVTTVDGCDSILRLHLVMNYVSDTLNWANVEECDSWFVDTVACDGTIGRKYIDQSGDYQLRTRNAATGRDQISRIHLTINRSEHQTVVETQCVPWTWNVSSEFSHEIVSDTVLSQELETASGCRLIKVLRFTAKYPTENVTPVTLCQNGSWTDGNSVVYDMTNYELGENAPVQWNLTTNVAGCDSVDKVVFTVNPIYDVTAEETYCESEFTDGPIVYVNPNNAAETVELTIPGALNQVAYTNTVIANWTTALGCDSIVTITYTVNPSVTEEVTVQNCYTYTWNGREYNTLGETEDTFETVSTLTGCDSIAILHLTLTDTVIGVVTIEACGEYTYNNVTYRESKTFIEESGLALSGCDSVTHFVYNLTPRVMKDVYVVANAPYTWDNGQTYTTNKDGIYYDATLPGACDSILVLHLTMEQPIVICENELPYNTGFGVILTEDTSKYTETINGVLYDIDYTVNHNTVETVTVDNACDSYEWHGVTYTESGNYTFDTLNANGCDSTVTLALTVNVSTDSVLTAVACDSYDWSGIHFTASADTTIVGQTNAKGCDSTATLHLTINVNPGVEETVAICNSYVWNNQTLTVTGDYNQSFNDANGCTADSVLHLTINTPTDNNLVIIDNAASTYYNGTYYADINEANGGLPYTFDVLYEGANVNGCDSTDHVTLYVTRGVVTDENFNICGNFTWTRNNHTYVWIDAAERQANGNALYKDITDATAPVYIHTGENPTAVITDAMGVPDTTYVLWLNMIEANYFTVDLGDIMLSDVASMNVNPGDSLDTQTLDFSEYITNKQGEPNYSDTIHHTSTYYCENVVTYTANLIYNYDTVAPVTVCDATSWTDPVEGVHSVTTGANEFDYVTADNWHHHIVVTNKARTNSDHQVVTACDTYTWTAGDSATYTTSGSYTWNNNDTAICSLETLDLTVNNSNAATDQHVACDTYTWINGTTYTASNNTDTVMRTNVAGCDSTVTLDLTINYSNTGVDTKVACDSYTWINGTTYTASNTTDTAMRTNVAGCDSVITLNLTINTNAGSEATVAQCLTYTWNVPTYVYDAVTETYVAGTDISNTYNGSADNGDKTVVFTDANGCVGTATLHLTIYDTVNTASERFEYGNGFTFHGSFYTPRLDGTDSTYTIVYDTVDANNCAIKDTLTLHVSQFVYSYINKVECGSYTWTAAENGNDHTYRTLTAEEATANPTAAFFDVTANAAVANMQQNVDNGNVYVLNLTLNTPVVNELPVINVPMSQLDADSNYIVDGRTINCAAAILAANTMLITQDFSMDAENFGPFTACDSIVRYSINVIYNYVNDDPVGPLCAATTYEVVAGDVRTITTGTNTLTYTLNAGQANEEVHTVVVTNKARTNSDHQVVTACDTYTWTAGDSAIYTTSGSYTWNNNDTAICSLETLDLTVNNSNAATDVHVACDTYTWINGTTYTASNNTDTVMRTNVAGCDSTVTLDLTINYSNTGIETLVACDSTLWNGKWYKASNTTDTAMRTNVAGCDSVVTLNLTINYSNTGVDTQVACDSALWNNTWYYASNTTDTAMRTNVAGCDSVATLNLTINHPETKDTAFWFGDGSYRYTGIFTTATGHMYTPGDYTGITETVAGVTANGCDSIYNITLHVGNNYTHTEVVRSCATYTWTRNNITYARLTDAQAAEYPTAIYFDQTNNEPVYYNPVVVEPRVNDYADEYMLDLTLDAITERDTTINFPVSMGILTYAGQNYNYTISNDEGREFADTTYEYEIHLNAVQACDSIINLTVNVVNNYVFDSTIDLCYSVANYTWEGQTLTLDANPDVANTYYMYSANDADTTVHWIKLNQHPIQYVTERRTECESYTWNGRLFTESTSGATMNLTDQYGCDSTVTLVLTINHATNQTLGTEDAPVEACDGYTWTLGDGTELPEKIEQSGTYTWDYTTAEGCESHDTLYLLVNLSTHTEEEVTACDSYTWDAPDGNTYVMVASEEKLVNYNNAAGCASTAKMTLTINQSSSDAVVESACDSYTWAQNGETYTESGIYTDTIANAVGCDSIITLTLTIDQSNGRTEVTACDSYTWTLNGETYTESGAYEHISDVANTCGSLTDSLFLTINKNSGHLEEVAICSSNLPAGGYIWNGNAYTVDGEYYYDYTDDNNCLSQDTLKLTIGNVRSYGRVYVENCGPYTWDVTGETFTESTEASTIMAGANAVGCDSVLMLYLTIYEQPVVNETAVVCNNEPYIWHGQTLETTGEYTVTAPYDEHCDSLYVLNLTVNEITYSTTDVTACDSYEWNGETYTENGVYTYNTTNAAGCDSVATLNLTINANSGHVVSEAVCDSYEWHGVTYTESGEYYYNYNDGNNCASEDTLLLTIANSENNTVTDTACDSYTWTAGNGETYTESGTYVYNYTTGDNCTGVKTLVLTVNSSNSSEETFEACDSYEWNGVAYTESGVYTYQTTNVAGCDSVVTLTLTVNNSTEGEETTTACNYYTWNGTTYTTSGDYTYNTTNAAGCDSVATLHLTVGSSDAVTISEEACDSYTWNGAIYTQSGDYTYAGTNAAGCDSVVTLHLTIKNGSNDAVQATACNSYVWTEGDGQTYTESGVYTYTTNAANGCDSVVTLTLTINTPANTTETVEACDSYTWNNQTYTTSGVYTNDYVDVNGCDATATLNLTVKASTSSSEIVTACGAYEWNGQTYTQTGVYTYTTTNAAGCDSTTILSLVINQGYNTAETVTACDSYEWNGTVYTASGVYTFDSTTADGCDSVATLTLTINENTASNFSASACDMYIWNNQAYTESGSFEQVFPAANGCDSTVTLNLTINAPTTTTIDTVNCGDFNWNGNWFTQSGSYTQVFQATNGCDSTVILNLTINQAALGYVSQTACDSYTWYGETYTTSGSRVHVITGGAANGCDSIITLNLTINTPNNTTENVTACESYTWNGQTYTTTGVYTATEQDGNGCTATATLNLVINTPATSSVSVTNCDSYTWTGATNATYTTSGSYTHTYTAGAANGCDSTVTLNLTINNSTTENVYAEACTSYPWNGQTYSQSGVYTYQTTNLAGCDSTVTLLLNISQAAINTVTETACDSYTWTGATNATYTTSGSYTYTTTGLNGCDSTVTLNLTINNSVVENLSDTACGSYSWNGQTYYTSGIYTQTFAGSNTCDSTVNMTLVINTPTTETVVESACSSYEWNGIEYTTSGTYTHTSVGANGCDSVTTLHLTINQPVYVNLDVNAEGSYNWNGETYTESGVYTYTTVAANGCDSVTTLNLTVTPVYTVTLVSINDEWGTVSESGTIAENGYFTATATANEDYVFLAWVNSDLDTVSTNSTYVFQVTEDITLYAVFVPKTIIGIDDVDTDDVTIYSADSRIFVRGAEGKDVYVYDVNGRMMERQLNAPDAIEFRMTATGVYLVKVGNAPAKRVVLVR